MGSISLPRQEPSRFEKHVVRTLSNPNHEFRNSHARTPHHLIQGTITPNRRWPSRSVTPACRTSTRRSTGS